MNALIPIHPQQVKGPFAVLDIGSSKLACLIIEQAADGSLTVLSHAMHASAGIQRGEISDLAEFSATLGKVVEAAERKASLTVKDLHIVMPGGRIASQISRHQLELADSLVGARDIRRLLTKQFQSPLPEGRALIQTEELGYMIDGHHPVRNPKGMRASHLSVDITSLTIDSSAYLNVSEAAEHNHLSLGRLGNAAAASGLSCLTEEERDLGALILDMGGGTTSAALFLHGGIIGLVNVPLGGIQITRDIANILSLSLSDAERLKAMEGSVTPSHGEALGDILAPPPFAARGDNFVPASAPFQMQDLQLSNGEVISRQFLADVIRPRIEEILDLIQKRLEAGGLANHISKRVVLTGGASQLTGMADFVSQYWQRHASLAHPIQVSGLDDTTSGPAYAAPIGMALQLMKIADTPHQSYHPASLSRSPFGRLGLWLRTHL